MLVFAYNHCQYNYTDLYLNTMAGINAGVVNDRRLFSAKYNILSSSKNEKKKKKKKREGERDI